MFRSLQLGTAFGIGIYLHWTFFLLPLFLFLTTLSQGLSLATYVVILVFALCPCIILHELGHALMARHFGIPTRDITLYPIGGVARLGSERPGEPISMTERPWHEFCIALAGPAVNVVLAALFGLLLTSMRRHIDWHALLQTLNYRHMLF